jgi:hypothetical protein
VVYGSNQFIVVGERGTILSSTDGFKWSLRTSGTTNTLAAVTYGNNLFIAVGPPFTPCLIICPSTPAQVLTSSDGITWNIQNISTTSSISDVTFGNDTFLAVGISIFGSANGLDWSQINSGTTSVLNKITYDGSYAAVGDDGSIITSDNGSAWVVQSSGTTNDLYGITFGNNIIIAVGDGGIILSSSDGKTWIEVSKGRIPAFIQIVYEKDKFVAVGSAGTILTSADGKNWVQSHSGVDSDLSGVSFGNGTFVAVGKYKECSFCSPSNTILVSSDGISWSKVSGPDTIDSYRKISYGNNTFVALASSAVIISNDGITWKRIPLEWDYLYDIKFGNGTFVIVGAYGLILTSTDGVNWTQRTSGVANQNLYSVAFGNNIFVTAGGVDTLLTSANGVSWTKVTLSKSLYIDPVLYMHDRFVAVGFRGNLTSYDGITWFESPSAAYDLFIQSVAYGNNTIVGVGLNGAILQSDPLSGDCTVTLSTDLALHNPIINFNGTFLQGDATCQNDAVDGLICNVTSYGPANPADFSNCEASTLTSDFKLHIPAGIYNYISYQADFESLPSTDGKMCFRVVSTTKN